MPMGDDPNGCGGSRRWILRAAEDSLRRLGTEWIDLYQVHRPDPDTDVDETLGALTDLVQQGKVRYIGSSSFAASQIVEAQWTARDRRLERFRAEQPPYSLLVRGIEPGSAPATSAAFPVAGGRSRDVAGPNHPGLAYAVRRHGPASRQTRAFTGATWGRQDQPSCLTTP